jgi:V-type H+-transporting ATPase subunit D
MALADFNLTGLGRGGVQVQKARETYAKAVETLVELASLQVRVHRVACNGAI